jgi:hypothetical protein
MQMKIHKTYIIIGLIIALAAFVELSAHADELNQTSTLTFSQPIEVPGQVLPAGTYVFRLASSDSNLNIVQIFNSDQSHLYGSFQTISAERRTSTDDTSVTLAEQGSGNPDALVKWFYPGRMTGHEFVYSKAEEKAIAHDQQQVVEANQQPTSNSQPAGMGN